MKSVHSRPPKPTPADLRAAVGTSVLVLLFALAHVLARAAPRPLRRHAHRD